MAIMQSPPNAETQMDGRRYLYFCGTSYHSLHGHPQVVEAACEATRKFGLGSATTRTGFGNTPPTLEVEQQAAAYFESESAFYSASGYVGNQILVSTLSEAAHVIFMDAGSHYSVIDASRLSALPVQLFAHANAESLEAMLRDHLRPGQVPLVLSDGVFAARGTIAPVRDYCAVLRHYPHALLSVNATLGGAPSAAAMAITKDWSTLVLPAILMGIWGYVIGTFLGVLVGELLMR